MQENVAVQFPRVVVAMVGDSRQTTIHAAEVNPMSGRSTKLDNRETVTPSTRRR